MKSGIKSTEFWFGLFVVILTYFNQELGLNIPIQAIILIVATAISYIIGRTIIKAAGVRHGYGK